jgi:hypothetical protein
MVEMKINGKYLSPNLKRKDRFGDVRVYGTRNLNWSKGMDWIQLVCDMFNDGLL